jgi:hypothetical protein
MQVERPLRYRGDSSGRVRWPTQKVRQVYGSTRNVIGVCRLLKCLSNITTAFHNRTRAGASDNKTSSKAQLAWLASVASEGLQQILYIQETTQRT